MLLWSLVCFLGIVQAEICGCTDLSGKKQCNPCCGPKQGAYSKVWESDFSKLTTADLNEYWEQETFDPEQWNSASQYVDDGSTVFVADDHLHIEMKPVPNYKAGAKYFSGKVKSQASFTYGLFIVSTSHIPKGCGMWPAIWMVPDTNKFGSWPHSGELDLLETINEASFMASSMNYGSCERGQNEWDSYCRHRSADLSGPVGTAENSTYAIEWSPDYIYYFHWTDATAPPDAATDFPDPTQWISQRYGAFYRAGYKQGQHPNVPVPPYKPTDIDGVAGFVCPDITSSTPKSDYDSRCNAGDEFCPGADTFLGLKGGGGCDFDAPFGPAVCDDEGMRIILNVKLCGKWPSCCDEGKVCCQMQGGAFPDLVANYTGKQMAVRSVRVFQKAGSPTRRACCPYSNADLVKISERLKWLCSADGGMVECSPVAEGGLYYTNDTLAKAAWVFDAYFQRNGALDSYCDSFTSHITQDGLSRCGTLTPSGGDSSSSSSSTGSSSSSSSSSTGSSSSSSSSSSSTGGGGGSSSSSTGSSTGSSSSGSSSGPGPGNKPFDNAVWIAIGVGAGGLFVLVACCLWRYHTRSSFADDSYQAIESE